MIATLPPPASHCRDAATPPPCRRRHDAEAAPARCFLSPLPICQLDGFFADYAIAAIFFRHYYASFAGDITHFRFHGLRFRLMPPPPSQLMLALMIAYFLTPFSAH
jgi:hypothetical protein